MHAALAIIAIQERPATHAIAKFGWIAAAVAALAPVAFATLAQAAQIVA